MKSVLLILVTILLFGIAGTMEYKNMIHEELYNMPDIVYENIYLQLDDPTEENIVKYYYANKAWCDSLIMEDI